MKLQNLIIIFLTLALPVILVLSSYTSLAVETVDYKGKYQTYLINAAHETITAYELNTTDENYVSNDLQTEDNRIRNIEASLNIFSQSMASFFGSTNASRSYVMSYVPCLLFTLYDRYYIYVPEYLPLEEIKERKAKARQDALDEGRDPDAAEEQAEEEAKKTYLHMLKPGISYTKGYTDDDGNMITINYTLDNYVIIYTNDDVKKGYLVNPADNSDGKLYLDTSRGDPINVDITQWFNDNIAEKYHDEDGNRISKISETNSPYPWEDDSDFNQEKLSVIRETITSGLEQGMTLYKMHSGIEEFALPQFSETEWELMLHNVCFIAFMQGLPVGLTTFNTYTIAVSTGNDDAVVDTDMYFSDDDPDDIYYHRITCPDLGTVTNGYTEEDIRKGEDGTENRLACYKCVIQPSDGSRAAIQKVANDMTLPSSERDANTAKLKAYDKYIAMARMKLEKY